MRIYGDQKTGYLASKIYVLYFEEELTEGFLKSGGTMKTQKRILLLAVTLTCALFAQGPWAKKDWKQWSKDECKRVMEDSPWAVSYTDSKAQTSVLAGSDSSGTRTDSRIETSYIVQLRSALPIRQAFARQVLIQYKFDSVDETKKQDLLKQVQPIVDKIYDDVIVVHVIYGSNIQQYQNEMMVFWQTKYPPGTVPQDAFLNTTSAKKVLPIKFISPKGGAPEFELIFPRTVDGKPVIGADDKLMSIEFVTPRVGNTATASRGNISDTSGGASGRRAYAEFKVEKMMMDGKLVY